MSDADSIPEQNEIVGFLVENYAYSDAGQRGEVPYTLVRTMREAADHARSQAAALSNDEFVDRTFAIYPVHRGARLPASLL